MFDKNFTLHFHSSAILPHQHPFQDGYILEKAFEDDEGRSLD